MNDSGWWMFHRKIEDSPTWRRLNPFGRDVMIAVLNNVDYETGEWATNLTKIKPHVHASTSTQNIRTAIKIMVDTGFITDCLTSPCERKIKVINWGFYQCKKTTNTPQQPINRELTPQLTPPLTMAKIEKRIINTIKNNANYLMLTGELTIELFDGYCSANTLIIKDLCLLKDLKINNKKNTICPEKKSNAINLNTETWEWINLTEERITEYQNKYYHADVKFVLDNMIEKAKVGALTAKSWGGTIVTYLSNEHKWNKDRAIKKGEMPKDYRNNGIVAAPISPPEIEDDGPDYPIFNRKSTPEQREEHKKISWARQIRGGRHLPDGDPFEGQYKIKPEQLAGALDWYHNQGGKYYGLPEKLVEELKKGTEA